MILLLDIILEIYACLAFQVLTAAYSLLSIFRAFGTSYGRCDKRTPLLLVHGYMNNPAVFWLLIANLRKLGIKNVHAVTLRPPWGSAECYAKQVSHAVDNILEECGSSKVDILAHSMGGVVVAHYLKYLDGHKKTRRFMAAATPFRGTYLAYLGSSICALQMLPRSRFMRRLDFGAQDAPSVKVYSLRAAFDEYVLPNSSALLASPAEDIRFRRLGHGGLLLNSRSASRIAEVLAA